jgi:aryl-alcohol dehydrogenase-like predicted oxidoreductase
MHEFRHAGRADAPLGDLPEDEAQPFFRKAVESGINFFDTANHYNFGDSEKITGKALKAYARRDEIVVATKVGLRMSDGRPNDRGLSRKHIFDQIDQSLGRLGMDYVDLLYMSTGSIPTPNSRKCSMRSKP